MSELGPFDTEEHARHRAGEAWSFTVAGASRQIESVSFGEEKPRAAGHDETSWAQNRRSDIVYKRE